MKLQDLVIQLEKYKIEEFYDILGYNYEQQCRSGEQEVLLQKKKMFLDLFNWIQNPRDEIILRLFNQINTYYAESWAFSHLDAMPIDFINSCNHLIIYKQGKGSSLRNTGVSFGERKILDSLDPIRKYKWIQGIAPRYLDDAIAAWSVSVNKCEKTAEIALFLSFALIAIHPLTDGNGRLARIAYSWMRRRWDLEYKWIREGSDGELYRTGRFQDSTEHLMGKFITDLCGGYNEIPYTPFSSLGKHDDSQAYSNLKSNLDQVITNPSISIASHSFKMLENHLGVYDHYSTESPRFKCLINYIGP